MIGIDFRGVDFTDDKARCDGRDYGYQRTDEIEMQHRYAKEEERLVLRVRWRHRVIDPCA